MAITFVKRSALPEPIKGKVGTLSLVITGNGQIQLSTLATKYFEDQKTVMAFDGGKVYLFKSTAPIVKKGKIEEKDMITVKVGKKGGTSHFSGTQILRSADVFGEHLYDFKASGNQSFALTQDDKNMALTFELPKGALAAKPVVHRAKKAKVTTVRAEAGSTDALPQSEEELELVPA